MSDEGKGLFFGILFLFQMIFGILNTQKYLETNSQIALFAMIWCFGVGFFCLFLCAICLWDD